MRVSLDARGSELALLPGFMLGYIPRDSAQRIKALQFHLQVASLGDGVLAVVSSKYWPATLFAA